MDKCPMCGYDERRTEVCSYRGCRGKVSMSGSGGVWHEGKPYHDVCLKYGVQRIHEQDEEFMAAHPDLDLPLP